MAGIRTAVALLSLVAGLHPALADDYPISGAWTFAPTNSDGISSVRRACRAFRYNDHVTEASAAGRLVVFEASRSTWYNREGVRSCRMVSVRRLGAKLFDIAETCLKSGDRRREHRRYSLKRLNSLQVLITLNRDGARPRQLIGCP